MSIEFAADTLTNPALWVSFGNSYASPQGPVAVAAGGGIQWVPNAAPVSNPDSTAFLGVKPRGVVVGQDYMIALTATGSETTARWRLTIDDRAASEWVNVDTTDQTVIFPWTATVNDPTIGIEVGPGTAGDWANAGTFVIKDISATESKRRDPLRRVREHRLPCDVDHWDRAAWRKCCNSIA